jgi:hypothetical protein
MRRHTRHRSRKQGMQPALTPQSPITSQGRTAHRQPPGCDCGDATARAAQLKAAGAARRGSARFTEWHHTQSAWHIVCSRLGAASLHHACTTDGLTHRCCTGKHSASAATLMTWLTSGQHGARTLMTALSLRTKQSTVRARWSFRTHSPKMALELRHSTPHQQCPPPQATTHTTALTHARTHARTHHEHTHWHIHTHTHTHTPRAHTLAHGPPAVHEARSRTHGHIHTHTHASIKRARNMRGALLDVACTTGKHMHRRGCSWQQALLAHVARAAAVVGRTGAVAYEKFKLVIKLMDTAMPCTRKPPCHRHHLGSAEPLRTRTHRRDRCAHAPQAPHETPCTPLARRSRMPTRMVHAHAIAEARRQPQYLRTPPWLGPRASATHHHHPRRCDARVALAAQARKPLGLRGSPLTHRASAPTPPCDAWQLRAACAAQLAAPATTRHASGRMRAFVRAFAPRTRSGLT